MKFHVFWFPEYYPMGGLFDYAGPVDAGSLEEVRAFILRKFQQTDLDLENYQIADQNMFVLETGRLMERWLDGKTRMPKTIEPDPEPRTRYCEVRFSTEGEME